MGQNSDPMNLVGAGTATGAYAALRQMIADKIAAEERARRAMVEDRSFGLQNRQLDLQDQMRRDQLAETTRQHSLADAEQQARTDASLNDNIPAGREIGAGSPVFGRLERIGALAPKPLQVDAPPTSLAADPTAGAQELPGTVANAPSPIVGRLYTKQASEKQATTAAAAEDKRAVAEATAADKATQRTEQAARDTEIGRHNKAMENKPAPVSTVTIQTVDENGKPVTRVVPKSEAIGKSYAAKPSATTEGRLASAEAVTQTGNDIIAKVSDPQYAKSLGSVMGRYSKLQDFIGNPPPEFSELAGAIESYALANMGVHGMRSAQGAQMIAHLLNQPHTPESIVAAIKGLNRFSEHFMQNAGRGTAPSDATKPSAADLIKKYGGQP